MAKVRPFFLEVLMPVLANITAYVCMAIAGLVTLLMLIGAVMTYFDPQRRRKRREARRIARGEGLGVIELARRLDMPMERLTAFTPRYTRHEIPKRRGGMRPLDVPDAATKQLQRRILRKLLAKLRVHPAVQGFEKGKSIVTNALPHAKKAVVIKLDIANFFSSTSAARIDLYFRHVGWDAAAAALLTKLVTLNDGLPQGAPTSPRLSNLVNFHLDFALTKFAARRKMAYTRYADDITFSAPKDYPGRVRGTVQWTRITLKRLGYSLNKEKTRVLRRHQRQQVTGLIVNDQPALPRALRRKLRAIAHHHETGKPGTLTPVQLAGYAALQQMIAAQRQIAP